MEVISLNVACPATLTYGEREFFTGGAKMSVSGAFLRFENFDGDGQADLENHGGLDKAVCVYPADHYAHWERVLARRLSPGSFSENLTVAGAVEAEICIGDVFRVGEATVQVSQPRTPCGKLAARNAENRLGKWISEKGYTGFYMRVLAEGFVRQGDGFDLVERNPAHISVSDVNDAFYGRTRAPELVARLAVLPELGSDGRAIFAERLRSAS